MTTADDVLTGLASPVVTLPVDVDGSVLSRAVPSELGESPQSSNPEQTAGMFVAVADLACSEVWQYPLTDDERGALQRDLAAVLAKHDVPDLPFQEELALGLTAGGIIYRRVKEKRIEGAKSDRPSNREKGEREKHGVAAPHFPTRGEMSQIDDLLA